MENFTIKVVLSARQRTEAAMRQQGISPAALAIKPGTRVQKDRKLQAKRGITKHKSSVYAYD